MLRPAVDFKWMERQLGSLLTPNAKGIVNLGPDGSVQAGVAFDRWSPGGCEAHMVASTPFAVRELIGPAFDYVFSQAGRRLIYCLIQSSNERSLRLARWLGFEETYRIKDGWSYGDDFVLLEMRRENCRWLTPEFPS
jgi:hypothetical protein